MCDYLCMLGLSLSMLVKGAPGVTSLTQTHQYASHPRHQSTDQPTFCPFELRQCEVLAPPVRLLISSHGLICWWLFLQHRSLIWQRGLWTHVGTGGSHVGSLFVKVWYRSFLCLVVCSEDEIRQQIFLPEVKYFHLMNIILHHYSGKERKNWRLQEKCGLHM